MNKKPSEESEVEEVKKPVLKESQSDLKNELEEPIDLGKMSVKPPPETVSTGIIGFLRSSILNIIGFAIAYFLGYYDFNGIWILVLFFYIWALEISRFYKAFEHFKYSRLITEENLQKTQSKNAQLNSSLVKK